jgi:transposase
VKGFVSSLDQEIPVAKKKKKQQCSTKRPVEPGHRASSSGKTLRTYDVGALPIINQILQRMRLPDTLRQTLPSDDSRTQLATYRGLLVLVRNLLVAREPVYGVGQWAARYAPDLLDLWHHEVERLNDDRVGRCLDRLFDGLDADLIMNVVRQVIDQFHISLDELHNDSTSVSFFGAYSGAEEESRVRGRRSLAITFGHSKDHRPDLKQLLYILTVSNDGGVPLYFTSASGNTSDDTTHRQTWDLLQALVGRADFLYVADCKLATSENMNYIARQQDRFITVLPRTRKEDQQFRQRLLKKADSIRWHELYTVSKEIVTQGKVFQQVVDRLSVSTDEMTSREGYRLLWYHSRRKAERDAQRRARQLQRATRELTELRDRLQGPKSRFAQRSKVDQAVEEILKKYDVDSLLPVEVLEEEKATYRQASKGRPSKNTKYVKQVKKRFDISWSVDPVRLAEAESLDGIFPLISNVREMTAEEILRAYKRQPIIEKRFSQLKTDFSVAPVYLKSVTRIQALLGVYFFALMVQTLLERELRQAMQRAKIESLPLYPEGRACRRPTTRKIIDLFDGVQRHELKLSGREPEVMVTQLSPVQKEILKLLGITAKTYGH